MFLVTGISPRREHRRIKHLLIQLENSFHVDEKTNFQKLLSPDFEVPEIPCSSVILPEETIKSLFVVYISLLTTKQTSFSINFHTRRLKFLKQKVSRFSGSFFCAHSLVSKGKQGKWAEVL